MIIIFFVVILRIFLVFVLYLGIIFIRVKDYNFFKVNSFESGFKRVGKVQLSYSIHFFVIILIFVVFDLEIVILMGLVVSDFMSVYVYLYLFVFVLGGLVIEWLYGKLVWVIY